MDVRHEALLTLDKGGKILETARDVSAILRANRLRGAIVGGIAVVLHGYVRTTADVDAYVNDPEAVHAALISAGFRFDAREHEFNRNGIPVRLVTDDLVAPAPARVLEREGIVTVSLVDLINIKLHSGLRSITRAIDIADVIGLIRKNDLDGRFAARVDKRYRAEFKKLLKAVATDRQARRA